MSITLTVIAGELTEVIEFENVDQLVQYKSFVAMSNAYVESLSKQSPSNEDELNTFDAVLAEQMKKTKH